MKPIKINKKTDCLLVTDIQNDFCPGGALGVRGGARIVHPINRFLKKFRWIVASQDWHPPNHCSFWEQGGPWPPHCVRNTRGAAFHAALKFPKDIRIVQKAIHRSRDAYSAFRETGLKSFLKRKKIRRLFIVGLTTEYCVKWSALDGLHAGLEVWILNDLVRSVRPSAGRTALIALRKAGVLIVPSRVLR
jgi:nicotinamidase/pyrazinamidase